MSLQFILLEPPFLSLRGPSEPACDYHFELPSGGPPYVPFLGVYEGPFSCTHNCYI